MISPERIPCETDGPYCRNGSRPAEPADVLAVADALAATWATDPEGTRQALASNARAFIAGKLVVLRGGRLGEGGQLPTDRPAYFWTLIRSPGIRRNGRLDRRKQRAY